MRIAGTAPPAVPTRVTPAEIARVAIAMLAAAAALNFRLITRMSSALPSDLGDPLLNTFILGWDADRLRHGLKGVWDAPFYFPLRDTLAFSEHLLGIAIFTAPVQWLTGNPVLAYNAAFIGSYVLAGVGMYVLARSLWGRADAAWVAAVAFACAPNRVAQTPHLQTLMSGWMPLGLWALHRYFSTHSRRALAAFAAAFILQALSNGYFLYFYAVPVVVVVAAELWRGAAGDGGTARGLGRRLADLSAAAAVILAVLAPVAAAYIRVRARFGLHRLTEEIESYSATLSDYLRIPDELWLWRHWLRTSEGERELFPGLLVTVLAAVALATVWRTPLDEASRGPSRRFIAALYATILVLGVWLSLGPGVFGPYRLLLDVVPGLNGLRVPPRVVIVVILALNVLAAGGAAWIFARLRPRTAAAAAGLIALLIVAEGAGRVRSVSAFDHMQPRRAGLNAFIRESLPGAVLELPAGGVAPAPGMTTRYQFNTLLHGRPVVNGYSGYGYNLQDFLERGASPLRELGMIRPMLAALRRLGIRALVMHKTNYQWLMNYEPSPIIALIDEDREQVVDARSFDYDDIRAWKLADSQPLPVFKDQAWVRLDPGQLRVTAWPGEHRARGAADGDPKTFWDSGIPQRGDEWMRIELDRERDVVALRLSLWGLDGYPRSLRVECEADDGSRAEVFSGPVLAQVMHSLIHEPRQPGIVITLRPNRTRALRLSQLGEARHAHWVVADALVWERTPAGDAPPPSRGLLSR